MAAEVNKPDLNFQWASGGAIVSPSDVKIQTGWTAEVPPFQWENFLQNRQDVALLHLFQKGISVWSPTDDYYFSTNGERSYVQGSDGNIYVALQDSLNQNPITATTYWKVAFPTAGRLLRTKIYSIIAGVQNVSVNGGVPSTTGASTFTALPTTTAVRIKCQGAGGGGGGSAATGAATLSAGGGGGAGAYAEGWFTSAFSSLAISVGLGGTAGPAGAGGGGTGGTSSAGVLVSSPGGTGSGSQTTAQSSVSFFGGTGPSAAPTGGNIFSLRGGAGIYGIQLASQSANAAGGIGGASVFGAAPLPGSPAITSPGFAGINPGTGGSGGQSVTSSAAQIGGAGAPGIIIIEEYA